LAFVGQRRSMGAARGRIQDRGRKEGRGGEGGVPSCERSGTANGSGWVHAPGRTWRRKAGGKRGRGKASIGPRQGDGKGGGVREGERIKREQKKPV